MYSGYSCSPDIPLLNVLNPETLVTKAVATYLSEKRLLESHLSTEPMDGDQPTPVISVELSTPVLPTVPSTIPQVEVTNDEESGPLGSASTLPDQLLTKVSVSSVSIIEIGNSSECRL